MTAQPEEVDREQLLEETQPRTYLSAEALPTAEFATGLWRVVASDGSTRVFNPAPPADRPHDHQPAANSQTHPPAANRETPMRPQLSDVLVAEMLEADSQQRFSGEGRPGPAIGGAFSGPAEWAADARRLDAAVALGTGGQCAPLGARRAESVAATSDHAPSPAAVAPQLRGEGRGTSPSGKGTVPFSLRENRDSPQVRLQYEARCRYIDPQLARIIDLWPRLPQGIQAAMLAMTEASREDR